MKTKTILLTIALTALAGSLFAQQTPTAGSKGDRKPPTPEAMLERFDTNQDGVIDLEEIEAAQEKRQQGRQERLDQRKQKQQSDGKKQKKGQRKDPAKMAERVVEKFDTDEDGLLSADELREFILKMQTSKTALPPPSSVPILSQP